MVFGEVEVNCDVLKWRVGRVFICVMRERDRKRDNLDIGMKRMCNVDRVLCNKT